MSNKISINDDRIEINGKIYVPENTQNSQNIEGDVKIVVLQRGWVYIGRFQRNPSGICTLKNAYNIQNWGTTNGLGELVLGPTAKTVLKKCEGTIEFDWLTVIHTIACKPECYPLI